MVASSNVPRILRLAPVRLTDQRLACFLPKL
jgi:hypothetical protein